MGVGVQLTMLTLLAGKLELHYLVATAFAVESAIIHNFFWHERWTWRDRKLIGAAGRLERLLRFNFGSGLISITVERRLHVHLRRPARAALPGWKPRLGCFLRHSEFSRQRSIGFSGT